MWLEILLAEDSGSSGFSRVCGLTTVDSWLHLQYQA